jgi:DNA polymerase III epsilon subunit-like protein
VIDTETSGLANFALPADHPDQPHLAELSIILCDKNLEPLGYENYLIKPDGWEVTPGATAVNGLTTERLEREGVPLAGVLARYVEIIDAGVVMIAHNAQYDGKIMRGELRRAGGDDRFMLTKTICTMRGMTEHCQLAGSRGKWKWPTLNQAYEFVSGAARASLAHSADNDATACLAVASWMLMNGKLPEPQVYFRKGGKEV